MGTWVRLRVRTIRVLFQLYHRGVVSLGLNRLLNYRWFMPKAFQQWVEQQQKQMIFDRPALIEEDAFRGGCLQG